MRLIVKIGAGQYNENPDRHCSTACEKHVISHSVSCTKIFRQPDQYHAHAKCRQSDQSPVLYGDRAERVQKLLQTRRGQCEHQPLDA